MVDLSLLKVIKYEPDTDDFLVYKYPEEDFNTKSQLIVHQSQEALFFKDGRALDLFEPGKHELKTENIPLLRNLINIPTEGESPFHCEIYFINKALNLNLKWGTRSKFHVMDPEFKIPLNVGASGIFEIKIDDSRLFVTEVVGTQKLMNHNKLIEYFREKITTEVKSYLARVMSQVSYLTISQNLNEISIALKNELDDDFSEIGIHLENFYLSNIFIPPEQTQKINEVMEKKMEYGQLGFDWQSEQKMEIAKKFAENPGSGGSDNIGGMMATMPMAMYFGEMMKDNLSKNHNNSDNLTDNNNSENNSSIFCNECGSKNQSNSKFCSQCGTKLNRANNCRNCGAKIVPKSNFCTECGEKL